MPGELSSSRSSGSLSCQRTGVEHGHVWCGEGLGVLEVGGDPGSWEGAWQRGAARVIMQRRRRPLECITTIEIAGAATQTANGPLLMWAYVGSDGEKYLK